MTRPVIMWFRQDLRLADHPALSAATAAGPVLPVFILDDETPGQWAWGGASRWWLHESLKALSAKVPLLLRRGRADEVLRALLVSTNASGLYFTRDYAPWSAALEARIKGICDSAGITCHRYGGFLLHEPEQIRNGSGQAFKVYTPFARACLARGEPRAAKPVPKMTWARHDESSERLEAWALQPRKPDWAKGFSGVWQPGEQGAEQQLARFLDQSLRGYAEGRDRPDQAFTSRLSPHLHWGEISPHRVWQTVSHAMQAQPGFLDRDGEKFHKELLWREFSNHLLQEFPAFPDNPYRSEFSSFPWRDDAAALKAWQCGETGYPIVDAGMRELWATGYMHNRVRMIAASFLIKHLLLPWQTGEGWFWDTLVDADIANNAASWQWVAGCGADAAPYFRIFNPVLQGEKFDPDGAYVKRWLPELRDVPTDAIHKPWTLALPPRNYARPIVDHGIARSRALAAFKSISKEGLP